MRKVDNNNNNKLCDLAMDILEKGIRAHTYKLRAQILLSIFKSQDVQCGNCIQVDCQTNVGYLASQLFKNSPSFEENSMCEKGCPARWKSLPVSQIDYNYLQGDFYNIIKDNVLLRGNKKCYRKDCAGFETTKLCKIGRIIFSNIFFYVIKIYSSNSTSYLTVTQITNYARARAHTIFTLLYSH